MEVRNKGQLAQRSLYCLQVSAHVQIDALALKVYPEVPVKVHLKQMHVYKLQITGTAPRQYRHKLRYHSNIVREIVTRAAIALQT